MQYHAEISSIDLFLIRKISNENKGSLEFFFHERKEHSAKILEIVLYKNYIYLFKRVFKLKFFFWQISQFSLRNAIYYLRYIYFRRVLIRHNREDYDQPGTSTGCRISANVIRSLCKSALIYHTSRRSSAREGGSTETYTLRGKVRK